MDAPARATPTGRAPALLVEGDGFPDAEIAAMRALPRFAEACRQAALSGLAHYRGDRLSNTVINDCGRSAIGFLALYLDRTREPDDPRSGLTLGRLKAVCAAQDIGSPGRIEAVVWMMRVFGLLKLAPHATDRRVRLMQPTERLVLLLRDRWLGLLAAMAVVLPEAIRAAFSDEDFERAIIRRMGEHFLAGIRPLKDARARALFGDRNAGLVIALALMTAGGPDDFPPRGPVKVSISALARRFGVSRVHVRTLLRDAADAGYIAWPGGTDGMVTVLPPRRNAVETFFASAFLYMRVCARDAIAEVDATPHALNRRAHQG